MNKRIKELAAQAWVANDQLDHCGYTDLEKFAELIVRECAGIDFRYKVGMTTDQEWDTSRLILEHFGVGE